MEKYTIISLYYLHIVPAYQLFHLNQYFLILEINALLKTFWDTGLLFCVGFFVCVFLSTADESRSII